MFVFVSSTSQQSLTRTIKASRTKRRKFLAPGRSPQRKSRRQRRWCTHVRRRQHSSHTATTKMSRKMKIPTRNRNDPTRKIWNDFKSAPLFQLPRNSFSRPFSSNAYKIVNFWWIYTGEEFKNISDLLSGSAGGHSRLYSRQIFRSHGSTTCNRNLKLFSAAETKWKFFSWFAFRFWSLKVIKAIDKCTLGTNNLIQGNLCNENPWKIK